MLAMLGQGPLIRFGSLGAGEFRVLISRIEQARGAMRPSEARVAGFVLARPHVAAELSIKDMAEAVGVSEPTVMRFCKAVGCGGYLELKRWLTRDLERRSPVTNRDLGQVADGDAMAARLLETVGREATALGGHLGDAGLSALAAAVDMVAGQRRITVAATDTGVSRAAADLADALGAIGLRAELGSPGAPVRQAVLLLVAGQDGARPGEQLARSVVTAGGMAVLLATGPVASAQDGQLAIAALPSAGGPLADRLALLVLMRALVVGVQTRMTLDDGQSRTADADTIRQMQASRERAHDAARRASRIAAHAAHAAQSAQLAHAVDAVALPAPASQPGPSTGHPKGPATDAGIRH